MSIKIKMYENYYYYYYYYYLHHDGDRMNPVHVPHEALCQVSYTQTDGPVSVALQSDHFISTGTHMELT